jgi:hypothetical protein
MKNYSAPIEIKATKGYSFGSFPKTYISGNVGDVFIVIGETKAYYITTNTKNNKLPKWITE